ncbi:MAG: peptide-methionine (S)-S-oxide reductase [Gammaproteobacteria bacterium]|nr:peptide-methionine (S)-S-oxide reductase [Gammaproteobacteria bacterium]|tara:strand:- start:119 stop:700 length:582 start_codon:yes stop_codon:yes gene_type:complete
MNTAKLDNHHFINGNLTQEPLPNHLQKAVLGLGCFWGAEKCFWEAKGVFSTAVGYAGGITINPKYEDICTGKTGHAEVVLVIFNPNLIKYIEILKIFWENHDPTQGNRQGNDVGTQYRSAIFPINKNQYIEASKSLKSFQKELERFEFGKITTEIKSLCIDNFYYAESYHQQYLAKNPNGYCGLRKIGIKYDI